MGGLDYPNAAIALYVHDIHRYISKELSKIRFRYKLLMFLLIPLWYIETCLYLSLQKLFRLSFKLNTKLYIKAMSYKEERNI